MLLQLSQTGIPNIDLHSLFNILAESLARPQLNSECPFIMKLSLMFLC